MLSVRLRRVLRAVTVTGSGLVFVDAHAHGGHAVPAGVPEQLHLHLLPGLDATVSLAPLLGGLALGVAGLLVLRRRLGPGRGRRRRG